MTKLPNIAISEERVKELMERSTDGLTNAKEYVDLFLEGAVRESWKKRASFWADLLVILEDYSALKTENDGWAEVLEDAANKHLQNLDKIARLEAELAKYAPLIEKERQNDIKTSK